MGLGPEQPIEAPPLTPPPNGLLLSAPVIDITDDTPDALRWENGIRYQGDSMVDAIAYDPCNPGNLYAAIYTDAATTSGSATLTSIKAEFRALDVGKSITGPGIPGGTTILSLTDSRTVVLSANATATATGVAITIAGPRNTRQLRQSLTPFPVFQQDTCSAFGFKQGDYEGRARRALAASESKAVEREFSLGAIFPANRHLQDTVNVSATIALNNSTAYSVHASLAALVQAVADYNLGSGMIHARPYLVSMWSSFNLLTLVNKKLYTLTGVLVVPGSGYPGGPPDQSVTASATADWAYATAPVQVMRGPVEVFASEADRAATLDRVNNTVTVSAQRMYAVMGNFRYIVGAKVDTTNLT